MRPQEDLEAQRHPKDGSLEEHIRNSAGASTLQVPRTLRRAEHSYPKWTARGLNGRSGRNDPRSAPVEM